MKLSKKAMILGGASAALVAVGLNGGSLAEQWQEARAAKALEREIQFDMCVENEKRSTNLTSHSDSWVDGYAQGYCDSQFPPLSA